MALTASEAGYCKNVSPSTVVQAIRAGKLKGRKESRLGRKTMQWLVEEEDLVKWTAKGQSGTDYISGYYRHTVSPERRIELLPLRQRWAPTDAAHRFDEIAEELLGRGPDSSYAEILIAELKHCFFLMTSEEALERFWRLRDG